MLRNRPALRRHGHKLMADIVHGSAVAIGGNGLLLLGPSGSGKSDLALRLIDRGAVLISDDIVVVETRDDLPVLVAAPNILGKIEVRGVGICSMEFIPSAPLRLVVVFSDNYDRMPPEDQRTSVSGFSIPVIALDPFEPSSAIKLELAMRSAIDAGLLPVARRTAAAHESSPF